MADFDPVVAGATPFDPAAAGATPVGGAGIPGGGLAAGNPPGFDAGITQQQTQQQAMALRSQTYANDMFPLFQAQKALNAAPTGKGSETAYDISSLLQTYAPGLGSFLAHVSPLMSPDQVAAYAEAKKYLTQAQLGVAGATRSNEGGQTASAASPSVEIPPEAAKTVIQNMIGLRRMEHDMTLQWQNSGQPVANLNKFVTQFQTHADPRVYLWDQQTPAQRDQILSKMTPAQRGQFIAKVSAAENNGAYNTFGVDTSAPPSAPKGVPANIDDALKMSGMAPMATQGFGKQ